MHCIAMAYGGEPLDRIVNGVDRGLVYLVHPSREGLIAENPNIGVGFPLEFVFSYDNQLLNELQAAYEKNDQAKLESLWKTASPLAITPTVH